MIQQRRQPVKHNITSLTGAVLVTPPQKNKTFSWINIFVLYQDNVFSGNLLYFSDFEVIIFLIISKALRAVGRIAFDL